MFLKKKCTALVARLAARFGAASKEFPRARRGNVAMIVALSLIPVSLAAGAGLDLSRAMIVRARLAEALDSAGLAVGASQTANMTDDQMKAYAQKYFDANYTADDTFGSPVAVAVVRGSDNITLSTYVEMPTTLMNIVGINTLKVGYSSQIVWGQTKLWVSLVLDNTGSMCEPDSCSGSNNKITALKSATHSLLTTLQNASSNPGDVKVAIIPFSKDVNVGTSYVGASWVDWTSWEAAPSGSTPGTSVGPGSSCPYSSTGNGYRCTVGPTNGSSTTSTIPSSGTYKGYICPGMDNGKVNAGRAGRYYNGCYDSVATKTSTTTVNKTANVVTNYSCTSNSSGTCTGSVQTGSTSTNTVTNSTNTVVTDGYTGDSGPTITTGSSTTTTSTKTVNCSTHHGVTTCTASWTVTVATPSTTVTAVGAAPFNHTWHVNDHSTWGGCIMDRTQDYDTTNDAPTSSTTDFPAENSSYCPPGTVTPLGYDWSTLSDQVDAMTANGNTNQTIGLQWGWQALSNVDPFNPGTLPSDTTEIIILLSDGLNTQNRWSATQSSIDARMALACSNAKTNGHVVIYTVFVDLDGAQGSSTTLYNCASDQNKYFDLTTTGAIISTFNNIAQQITQLRVAR